MDQTRRLSRATRLALFMMALAVAAQPAPAQEPDSAKTLTFASGNLQLAGQRLEVDLGTLRVPEVRGNPLGRTLTLPVVRFENTATNPGSPIVYLAGGPGEPGVGAVQGSLAPMVLALRQVADVIALELRGTGQAADSMQCPEKDHLPLDRPGSPERYRSRVLKHAASCIEFMQRHGIDLSGYTVEASVNDLQDLRQALGAEKLTLWAFGSGTHLALEMARRYPASVDRMILAGIQGPDQTLALPSDGDAALQELVDLAGSDTAYAGYPDLLGTLRQVLDRLDREPVRVEVLPKRRVVVGKWDLQKRLADAIESQGELERIPASIVEMSRGDFTDLGRWAYGFRRGLSWSAAALATTCASYASAERFERIASEAPSSVVGTAADYPLPDVCQVPGLPRLSDDVRAPVRSAIPTLFISGTLDGRTPGRNAAAVAAGFEQSQQLVLRGVTHDGLVRASPTLVETVLAFARGEAIRDTVIDGPTLDFVRLYPRSLATEVLRRLTETNYAATVDWYHEQRRTSGSEPMYDFNERVLNTLGYDLLRADEIELALAVFHLNTEAYPGGFNTWDSLGEGYLVARDTLRAIRNYRKSLALNPDNGNARAILSELQRRSPNAEGRRR